MKLKDKKIRLIEGIHITDDNGFGTDEWRPIHGGRLWAYYRQLSGREFYASATINAAEEVTFSINWRADIETYLLVEYDGQYYEITRIDDYEGYKNDLDLYCTLSPNQDIVVTEPEQA